MRFANRYVEEKSPIFILNFLNMNIWSAWNKPSTFSTVPARWEVQSSADIMKSNYRYLLHYIIIASRKHHTAFRVCTGQEKLEESIYLKKCFSFPRKFSIRRNLFKKNCSRITSCWFDCHRSNGIIILLQCRQSRFTLISLENIYCFLAKTSQSKERPSQI